MLQAHREHIKKRLRIALLRRILAGRFDRDRALVVASSPRSGSTLLAQVFAAAPGVCSLFEPLNLTEVPEAAAANCSWRTYRDLDAEWPEGREFFTRVFEGKTVNQWVSREIPIRSAGKTDKLLVKFVRANRLLPWLCHNFALPAPIFLMRHPCAVIASQLKFGWANAQRPAAPEYIQPFPAFQRLLDRTQTDVEYLAASWVLDQLPPLMQPPPHPWNIVTYEQLVLDPESTIAHLIRAWDLDITIETALDRIQRPSSVVSKSGISGLEGWKKQLSPEQIARVLEIVRGFGLTFYSESIEPDRAILHSPDLARNIQRAGLG